MGDENDITAEEYRMVEYFIVDKGDIESWLGWPRAKPKFEAKHPELIAALQAKVVAERTLTAVVESVCREY